MPFSRLAKADGQEYAFRLRYETFRALLEKNIGCLTILSDLEADLNHLRPSDTRVKRPLKRMFDETLLMAQELNLLSGNRFRDLYGQMALIREETLKLFTEQAAYEAEPMAVSLNDEKALKLALVGGKAWGVARLCKLFPDMVPGGFVLTTAAYRRILSENGLEDRIRLLLHDIAVLTDRDKLAERINTIRRWILTARIPDSVGKAMEEQAEKVANGRKILWAVRSSAVNEDGRYSFAGQFDSELMIKPEDLASACLQVLAGRFGERAVTYRLHVGLKEVDTPMAILFMPMVEPKAAGVIYTTDPREAESDKMLVNAVAGLGDKVIKGKVKADSFFLSREESPQLLSALPADESAEKPYRPAYLSEKTLGELGAVALKAAAGFGHDLDIEWATDKKGNIRLLQARRITQVESEEVQAGKDKKAWPVIEGGVTIFPGRAEGEVLYLTDRSDPATVPKGVVLVARDPGPEISPALPRIAALLAEGGNPVGHVATLTREFSVPAVFRMGEAARRLKLGQTISVNATKRTVFEGSRWPGIRERVLSRISAQGAEPRSGPLHDLVIALNLTDPDDSSFKARNCRSIHDSLRFMHEMAVRTLFRFGDEQNSWISHKAPRLATKLPVRFHLIGLDDCMPENARKVAPKEVLSEPFQALWRGMSDSDLHWPDRWQKAMRGMPREFRESVLGGTRGPRKAGAANYALLARDYMNLNARFAYHYALVDAMVGPGPENNHVHFRLRGGGGSAFSRQRRTRFLELVLRDAGFGVDRRGDLITAWLRRYPSEDSLEALSLLGRLIVCARQLDAVLLADSDAKRYAEYFREGKYGYFA